MTEDRGQRSEGRSQRTEDRCQKKEVGSKLKSEVGMRNAEKKTEYGIWKSECGSGKKGKEQKKEVGSRNAEVGKKGEEQKTEVGSRTRRRPKRIGLCRGKHAEGGKQKIGFQVSGFRVREWKTEEKRITTEKHGATRKDTVCEYVASV
jgi:hypothetical protein